MKEETLATMKRYYRMLLCLALYSAGLFVGSYAWELSESAFAALMVTFLATSLTTTWAMKLNPKYDIEKNY